MKHHAYKKYHFFPYPNTWAIKPKKHEIFRIERHIYSPIHINKYFIIAKRTT